MEIDDGRVYQRCRVQLHGKGIVLRDELPGSGIRTKKQQVCEVDNFIVAEIDAKLGSFGVIPPFLDGAIVSSHYFLFELDRDRLVPAYLDLVARTPWFESQVKAKGSTNYAAVRPKEVLAYQMPLPDLVSQRRLVSRASAVAALADQAGRSMERIDSRLVALQSALLFGPAGTDSRKVKLGQFLTLRPTDVTVEPGETYRFAGVYSFGRGVFASVERVGLAFAYSRLTRLHAGDLVYPKLMAWEGAIGVVPAELDGLVVSPEFPVFVVDINVMLPETLDTYFRNPSHWPELGQASRGTNLRRRRLHPRDFLELEMPIPPMSEQLKLRTLLKATKQQERVREKTDQELTALIQGVRQLALR